MHPLGMTVSVKKEYLKAFKGIDFVIIFYKPHRVQTTSR